MTASRKEGRGEDAPTAGKRQLVGLGATAPSSPDRGRSRHPPDTLALGLLCEATGKGLPVVVLPYLNAAQGEHPALGEAIERLRRMGVHVLFGPDVLPLHRPRQGKRDQFPWHLTLPALKETATHKMRDSPGQLQ